MAESQILKIIINNFLFMAKKKLYPNIVRGGIAIPIPNMPNYYYLAGKTHAQGGIDIGSNPKTGLEAEDKEVIKMEPKSIKVYSAQRFLGGNSPAELVMKGKNPDSVFKAQEDFKDRNKLNDDGTKKAKYGKKAAVVRTPEDEKISKLTRSYYKEVNPLAGYPGVGDAIKHGLNVFGRRYVETDSTAYSVTDKVADATWRKRLGLSYDEADLPSNADGSVRLPKDRELEMPVDTNLLKRRINANLKLSDKYKKQGDTTKQGIVDWAIEEDQKGLDSLRHTYKTGEPVVVNEQVYNTRSLINNGKISMPGSSPLNPLQNYTLQYDKDRNVMMYRDVYDFNHLDWAVPGKGYKIKGEIDLNKKTMGGTTNKPVTVTVNGKTKVVYSPSTGDSRSEAEGIRRKAKYGSKDKRTIEYDTKYLSGETYIPSIYTSIKDPIVTSTKVNRFSPYYNNEVLPKITTNIKSPKVVSTKTPEIKPINKITTNTDNKSNNFINSDNISLASNILGSVLSAGFNASAINKMKSPKRPISKQATKLKTKINISPLIDAIKNSELNSIRDIDSNTASSRVALNRKNRIRQASVNKLNTVMANKSNSELELINKDRLNRQTVSNANVDIYNNYIDKSTAFANKKQELRFENTIGLINNINSAIQGTINTKEKRKKDNNSIIAIMAANPNVNPQYLRDLGADWITDEMIANWKKANKKD